MNIFKPIQISGLSEIVSNKQATKTCTGKNDSKKDGILKNVLNIFEQKGGNQNITKQLKYITNKLKII